MDPIAGAASLRTGRFLERTGHDPRLIRREVERGTLVRVRRGVFVPATAWNPLTPRQRERLQIVAAQLTSSNSMVASHRSAAALWEIPTLRREADPNVHVLTTRAAGTRTEHNFSRHAVVDPALHRVAVHGVPCTSGERTVIDLARTESFREAVVATDWALRTHVDRSGLQRTLDELGSPPGRVRAGAVVRFGDGASGSVGESLSRVLIAEAGLPAPLLQVPFYDAAGLIGVVDFWWPDFGLIGEFDGRVKYADPAMLAGRSPSDVVFAEKRREDRLRAVGPTVARWVWSDLMAPGQLVSLLVGAGLQRAA